MNEQSEPVAAEQQPATGRLVRFVLLAIIVAGLGFTVLTGFLAHAFFRGAGVQETTTVIIPRGAGLGTVADQAMSARWAGPGLH